MPDARLDPQELPDHATANRESWNADADTYQADHGPQLAAGGPGWGVWQIPERQLQVLGDVKGLDVLEFGCGAGQWPSRLPKPARDRWVDLSEKQLEYARRLIEAERVDFPIVHASAEAVPLPDESFDIVFCDYGAMTFGDPDATVPEAARLLRRGGLLAFCGATPLIEMRYRGRQRSSGGPCSSTTSACGRCPRTATWVHAALRGLDKAVPGPRNHHRRPHRAAAHPHATSSFATNRTGSGTGAGPER